MERRKLCCLSIGSLGMAAMTAGYWISGPNCPYVVQPLHCTEEGGRALAVNDRGQVVGWVADRYGVRQACLWQPDSDHPDQRVLVDLAAGESSEATAVNQLGHIAGTTQGADGVNQACVWLPTRPNGTRGRCVRLRLASLPTRATGINRRDQVTGQIVLPNGHTRPFLWCPTGADPGQGVQADLGLSRYPYGCVLGINDAGQVVGWIGSDGGTRLGFVWTPSAPNGTTGQTTLLQPFGSRQVQATAINAGGEAVGVARLEGQNRAFCWRAVPHSTTGIFLDLHPRGQASSAAHSINSRGQVVGLADTTRRTARAYLLARGGSDGGKMFATTPGGRRLDFTGVEFSVAHGINNRGQAVGYLSLQDGTEQPVLWTP